MVDGDLTEILYIVVELGVSQGIEPILMATAPAFRH
jgi:hypothetical protein